ncbi:MAG: hypothetical protein AAGA75_16835 [Cyanobacteria bacterium P01_E01_bin.6]
MVQVGIGCARQGSRDTHCVEGGTSTSSSNESTEVTGPIRESHLSGRTA